MKSLAIAWQSLTIQATTEVFYPATDWIDAGGIAAARAYGESRQKDGTGTTWAFAIQTATDVRSPDAHTKITTSTSTAGMIDPEQVTLSINGKRYIRGGFAVQVTSGTGAIRIGGRIDFIPQ